MHQTPKAIERIIEVLGGKEPVVLDVEVGVLRWDVTPEDARLQSLQLYQDEPVVAWVHPRQGRWRMRGVEGKKPRPAFFLGVVEDALMFGAEQVPNPLWALGRVSGDATALPYKDEGGLAGTARLYAGGVAEWGSFAYHVPKSAEAILVGDEAVVTGILSAIDAAAGGPQEVIIVHAD